MPNIPILDYAILAFDTKNSPKHVAGLQVFDLPKRASADFVARLVEQLKSVQPKSPFNWRLEKPLIGMPRWVVDEKLDMDRHVFHESVPRPFTEDALLERIEAIHAVGLDRSGPLWQLYVFEHLAPNRFATYFKVHHAYMDGISLSRRAMQALSEDKKQRSPIAFWGSEPGRSRKTDGPTGVEFLEVARNVGRAAAAVPALAKLGLKHSLRLLNLGGGGLPVPFTAPRTTFNKPLTPERSVAVADISLDRVHRIAVCADVTVNDVMLELCDKAMTQYLDDHGETLDRPLVAQMPISLRRAGSQQGNQLTIALLELGSREANPVRRLQDIHTHASEVKREFLEMTPETAEAYTLLTQSIAQFGEVLGLSNFIPPLGNTVISNVIGPRKQLYLCGAPLVATYPISTIAPGTAMNITIYTYMDTLHLGIVAGHRAVPELRPLANYVHEALGDLETAMGLGAPKTAKQSAGSARKTKRKKASPKRASRKPVSKSKQRRASAR